MPSKKLCIFRRMFCKTTSKTWRIGRKLLHYALMYTLLSQLINRKLFFIFVFLNGSKNCFQKLIFENCFLSSLGTTDGFARFLFSTSQAKPHLARSCCLIHTMETPRGCYSSTRDGFHLSLQLKVGLSVESYINASFEDFLLWYGFACCSC